MSGMLLHAEQSIGKQMFLVKYDYTKSSCNSLCLPSISNVLDILAPYCCKAERNNRLCMELHVHLDKKSIDSSDSVAIFSITAQVVAEGKTIARTGLPVVMLTDQGTQLTGRKSMKLSV